MASKRTASPGAARISCPALASGCALMITLASSKSIALSCSVSSRMASRT
jgi:hypothetical protein